MSTRSVIVAGARTPIGKFAGGFSSLKAVDLGAVAIREAVARAGVDPAAVDYVIMGQVLQAGAGQITARQAAIAAGLPKEVPAITINKVCLSGLNAIALADQLIRAGEIEIAVAGGMESMTNAPYVIPSARSGARMGNTEMIDTMVHDGLWSTFTEQHMGESSDEVNAELELTREDQDAWSARSHQRAAQAWEAGRFDDEVVPVEVPQRKGEPAATRPRSRSAGSSPRS
jgi:acetyl-CoA C-acetyltransferase